MNISIKESPVTDLLKTIHKFYPIGMPFANSRYPGFNELIKLIEQKVQNATDKTLPKNYYDLLANLKVGFTGYEIMDESYLSFASYSISIKLKDEDTPATGTLTTLRLKLSLLINYYTIFFDQLSIYKDPDSMTPTIMQRIMAPANYEYDKDGIMLKKFSELVNIHFKDYIFVDHTLLLNAMIES